MFINKTWSLEQLIDEYQRLQYSLTQVSKPIGRMLLGMYLDLGFQQTIVCYIVFQMFKMGAGFTDVMFLLMDIVVIKY